MVCDKILLSTIDQYTKQNYSYYINLILLFVNVILNA